MIAKCRRLCLPASIIQTAVLLVLMAGSSSAASATLAATNVVTVRAADVTSRFVAYAQVEPVSTLPIRAAEAGTVVRREILPGAAVSAGQTLAELGGPEIQAALEQQVAAVKSAHTNLLAARKSLSIEHQQHASHLATQQTVLQAEALAAKAQAAFDTAQAQLRALRKTTKITAPSNGTVLAVSAAEGQRVSAGENLMILQPANRLWLKASYYGADAAAVHTGMRGQFSPIGGGKQIPVTVTSVFGTLSPDGGESVGLRAVSPVSRWVNGEFGTVTLYGPSQSLVAVPTRALILNQGQWWVLVRTPRGEQRKLVRPGPTRGWRTFIESGLKPGEQVVVENAYLEFHRGIAKGYRPPD